MSLLTGKAKQDFENYLMSLGCDEWDIIRLSKEEKEYYTIQFLDSVGIYIEISVYTNKLNEIAKFSYTIYGSYPHGNFDIVTSRHEATTEAIKQANIIYNNR